MTVSGSAKENTQNLNLLVAHDFNGDKKTPDLPKYQKKENTTTVYLLTLNLNDDKIKKMSSYLNTISIPHPVESTPDISIPFSHLNKPLN